MGTNTNKIVELTEARPEVAKAKEIDAGTMAIRGTMTGRDKRVFGIPFVYLSMTIFSCRPSVAKLNGWVLVLGGDAQGG